MGRDHDLLKHVKHNDIDKVQKLLTCHKKHHHPTAVKGDGEALQKERDVLLDLQKKESVSHVDINCHEPNTGSTPLILATLNGNQDLCSLLLHFGADVNATDSKG
ncbi:ankyrin repeat and MYND domain-containing protein 2-like [Limulus polyphemus]|uniref:Ankyrin repeat and MYND domain-containing protein 2-like n=1 Tax=Limulus polyphemus TaxID=6850 RepID=A0ABM1RXQ9_LIMPO|nr:ankyrin repeat and MYND domain-containing protein 2-like [Limulus polyphemus]